MRREVDPKEKTSDRGGAQPRRAVDNARRVTRNCFDYQIYADALSAAIPRALRRWGKHKTK